MLLAMIVIATAETRLHLILGIAFYGLAHGTTSPTLLAWATDLSDPKFKGKGVASVYIFMEFGIGFGAFASGLILANIVPALAFLLESPAPLLGLRSPIYF